ncbi:transposase [Streptomyces sp. NPDC048506]|uniref:transposase n=1 Tax=Streptomyces sp. NPDC048506 TaxID=3155028 RepID=UPI00341530FA
MAERLPDGNMQALQQFVSQSPWDHTPVLRAVAVKTAGAIVPEAWVIDDTSFPKAGDQSVGAARQWCGAGARSRAGVPKEVGHREKRRLALDAIDEALRWGLAGRIVVADAGYDHMHAFRAGLVERGLDYVVAVRSDTSARPGKAVPTVPDRAGRTGAPPLPRYRDPAQSLKGMVMAAGRRQLRRCTWRQGSRGAMTSRFMAMEVRPAGVAAKKATLEKAGGRADWDGCSTV